MPRNILLSFLMVLLAPGVAVRAGDKKPVDHAAVVKLVGQGDLAFNKNKLGTAMKAYEKADKVSRHTCVACYLRMAKVKKRVGDLSGARHETDKALKAAGDDKVAAADVHLERGMLFAAMAAGAKDGRLKKAEADFRQVLALDPQLRVAQVDLGVVLLREKRDKEGVAELKAFLATPGLDAETVAQVRRVIANPDRAREPYIPDFSVATLENGTITSASLAGKVVMLDFWGTWCEPCRNSVPALVDLHKRFAGRDVEIISISSDTDQQAWKTFIAKHQMSWPESIDLSGKMQEMFQVRAFPTYIVVDRQGIIRYRHSGFSATNGTEGRLEDAIKKALKRPYPAPSRKAGAHQTGR